MTLPFKTPLLLRWIPLPLLLLVSGCEDATDASDPQMSRMPIGKADALQGSCLDECGGESAEGCFCDEQCQEVGDCCADYTYFCEVELRACSELNTAEPAGAAECESRPDCGTFIEADCDFCGGGREVCVEIEPIPCDVLDVSDPADRDACQNRADCAIFNVPDCPECQGGQDTCVSIG